MAVHQCGMTSVVSVPNGAGSITDEEKRLFKETGVVDETRAIKLDYIDNCYNQLKDVEDYINQELGSLEIYKDNEKDDRVNIKYNDDINNNIKREK